MAIKLGIVDTTFSRFNMGEIAIEEIEKNYLHVQIERRTVPGIKDLAVECKKLLDKGCHIVMALGMVGGAPIDQQCAHEASLGIQQAKLMTNKHIIEVFVHENEAWSPNEFVEICQNRIRKHAHNAVLLVKDPKKLISKAGLGVRQGKENEGAVDLTPKIKIGIVVARFNSELTSKMEKAAIEKAKKLKVETQILKVPGVFDMPLAVKKLLMDKSISAVAVLGAVVKGDTSHDEVITKSTANRISALSLEFKKPVTLGIIGHNATENMAKKRTIEYAENALKSAIELVELLNS